MKEEDNIMPILIDLSQIAISNLMMSPNIKSGDVDELLIKHMILSSIRGYKKKFGREYGQVVICCDAKHYWRKDIFPHYKASRKNSRKQSKFDWSEVFTAIDNMKAELKTYFPYKVIEVDRAEGDDVIAIIAKNEREKTIIIGGDKDYCQLHVNPVVKQYSPTKKEFVVVDDATHFLNELVISGDTADGIPNIKSDADTFVIENKRQSPIAKKDIAVWRTKDDPKQFCQSRAMLENHKRNRELIDFAFIPEDIESNILDEYAKEPLGDKMKIMQYFIDNKMRMLIKDLDQF